MGTGASWLAAVLASAGAAAVLSGDADARAAAGPGPESAPHLAAPPPAHTGGFGEPTCLECHIGAPLNVPGGSLSLVGLGGAYEPGREYALTVSLVSEEMGAAGFQLSARFASGLEVGRPAGRLGAVDTRVTVTEGPDGVPYAHQTEVGSSVDDPERASWTLTWRAPAAGAVAFHLAANSANGDNSPLSDLVYATAVTLGPSGPDATPPAPPSMRGSLDPEPRPAPGGSEPR